MTALTHFYIVIMLVLSQILEKQLGQTNSVVFFDHESYYFSLPWWFDTLPCSRELEKSKELDLGFPAQTLSE